MPLPELVMVPATAIEPSVVKLPGTTDQFAPRPVVRLKLSENNTGSVTGLWTVKLLGLSRLCQLVPSNHEGQEL